MRPHPGTVDYEVCLDETPVRLQAAGTAGLDDDARHTDALENAGATLAGALCQGLGRVNRVGLAVARQVHGTDEVVHSHHRPERMRLTRREDVHLKTEAPRHGGAAHELFKTFVIGGEPKRAGLDEARWLSGFLPQGRIELGRVLGEAREVMRRAELPDEPGRMPGRAAGELLALEEHDVPATAEGQMVCNAAANDAAAHDHDAGALR